MVHPYDPDTDPLEVAAVEFENAWSTARPISVDDCLKKYQDVPRSELLLELLLVEFELRQKNGDHVNQCVEKSGGLMQRST
jgi:hypothetical protein